MKGVLEMSCEMLGFLKSLEDTVLFEKFEDMNYIYNLPTWWVGLPLCKLHMYVSNIQMLKKKKKGGVDKWIFIVCFSFNHLHVDQVDDL